MSTFFNDMQAALDNRLNTIAGGYDIAWPNVPYEPVAGETYLRPTFLPTVTEQASMGTDGQDRTDAIYQIDVFTQAGSGRTAIPDAVADHFKRGTDLTYNGTTVRVRNVSIAPAIIDGAWQQVPVSIDFYSYTDAR